MSYAYVGMTTQDVTPALARRYKLGAARGALIQSVSTTRRRSGGAAGSDRPQGVQRDRDHFGGDLIVAFAGKPVERAADIARIVTNSLLAGDTVSVTVLRGGRANARPSASG